MLCGGKNAPVATASLSNSCSNAPLANAAYTTCSNKAQLYKQLLHNAVTPFSITMVTAAAAVVMMMMMMMMMIGQCDLEFI